MTLALLLAVSHLAAPDVFMISVDTLRADHLGCYGHSHPTSPNIDALAARSLVFEDCICEVPLTAPSFGSMFSSHYPRTTGTTRNGIRMPDSVPLVAEQFQNAGYQTMCVQSNWTLKARLSGLNRGFEQYDDDFHKKRWGVLKAERYADEVTDLALAALRDRDTKRPLFLWVHYSDPHAPYRYHSEFNPSGKSLHRMSKTEKAGAKYDSEVAFADHHISRLLEALPEENAFILFVADHGESLYEHDYLGHGRRIYQPGLHIPLIINGPGIEPGRDAAPARGVDVGPTLLALAGLAAPEGMIGRDLRRPIPTDRSRVVETYGGAVPRVPGAHAIMAGRPPMRQGVIAGGWKLILRDKTPELYDLRRDPDELNDLAEAQPDRVSAMQTVVREWDKRNLKNGAQDAELSPEDIEALENLGYVE